MNLTNETATGHMSPSSLEAWGYGILCTTVINLCSLAGVIALPFIHGNAYKKILIFMVGLAVGTLAGSSLLFLIPEALELTDQELNIHSHVWKCLTIIMGIYVFFLIERVLKMVTKFKEKKQMIEENKSTPCEDSAAPYSTFHNAPPVTPYKSVDTLPHSACSCAENNDTTSSASEDSEIRTEIRQVSINFKHSKEGTDSANGLLNGTRDSANGLLNGTREEYSRVAPVAWMIIFGDGLHNFIDGVSIGAAFTESILAGLSVSIAILCEELPHELGDFAILLNAGMKIKKAVLYNFLSATMCYLGLVVGIFLGENTSTHTWVFAFAGGMFLYISLVDMMPEMNSAGESEDNKVIGGTWVFFLQNAGLIVGLGLMLIMAVYGGNLEEAIHSL